MVSSIIQVILQAFTFLIPVVLSIAELGHFLKLTMQHSLARLRWIQASLILTTMTVQASIQVLLVSPITEQVNFFELITQH